MTKKELQNQNLKGQNEKQLKAEQSIEKKQNIESRSQQQLQPEVQTKKKIIKKFPFTSKIAPNLKQDSKDDELKNWKPTSLKATKTAQSAIRQEAPKKKNQIFNQFLTSLPKPKQKDIESEQISLLAPNGVKKAHKQILIKPTEEQLKWDAQDQFLTKNAQTFITKNIQQKMERPSSSGENVVDEEVQDNEIVEKIVWLNEDNKGKNTNIAEIVSKTWEKQANLLDDDMDSDESEKNKKKSLPKQGNSLFKSKPFLS